MELVAATALVFAIARSRESWNGNAAAGAAVATFGGVVLRESKEVEQGDQRLRQIDDGVVPVRTNPFKPVEACAGTLPYGDRGNPQ